jgi:hypothetical protein
VEAPGVPGWPSLHRVAGGRGKGRQLLLPSLLPSFCVGEGDGDYRAPLLSYSECRDSFKSNTPGKAILGPADALYHMY